MTVIEFAKPRLSQQIGRYRFDPLGFVEFAFPWGRPGTALAGEPGPEPWQRAVLEKLGRGLSSGTPRLVEAMGLRLKHALYGTRHREFASAAAGDRADRQEQRPADPERRPLLINRRTGSSAATASCRATDT
jgi:hypothetical protein